MLPYTISFALAHRYYTDTSQFDKFTKHDYDQYIANKLHKNGMLEDTDPVAWFSLNDDRTNVINLEFR